MNKTVIVLASRNRKKVGELQALLTAGLGDTIELKSLSTESISLKPGASKDVTFRVYGIDVYARYNVITQGALTATTSIYTDDPGTGKIAIKAAAGFTGNGKVMLVVSAGNGSTKTMVKTINVAKED